MFGFFKDIKAAIASVEARVKAVEAKVESLFTKEKAPETTVTVTPPTEGPTNAS